MIFSNLGCRIPRQPNSSAPPHRIRKGRLISIESMESIDMGRLTPKEIQIIKKRHTKNNAKMSHTCLFAILPNI